MIKSSDSDVFKHPPLSFFLFIIYYKLLNFINLLETDRLGYNTNFTITNIYSGNSTLFSLSSFGQILSFITSNTGQCLHVLYDNGSIFTYALPNLELVDSYNFAYKQIISSYVYDKEETIYCTCNQKHDYMYSNRQSIIKIKIGEHQKPLESARIFPELKSCIYVLIAITYLLSLILNYCYWIKKHCNYFPVATYVMTHVINRL